MRSAGSALRPTGPGVPGAPGLLAVLAGVLAAVLVALLVLVAAPPARADGAEGQPTEQQVLQARERARALREGERHGAAEVEASTAAVEAAAAESSLALEAYRAAAETRHAALVELTAREAAVAHAEADVLRARGAMGRWVREAYVDGGTLGTSPGVYTLLAGGTTDDVATHRTWLQRVGRSRSDVVEGLRAAAERWEAAADDARRAATAAEAAAAQADAASAARDAVLAAQRRKLTDLQVVLAGTREAAVAAEQGAAELEAARVAAGLVGIDGGSSGPGGAGGNRVTGAVGDCAGGDVSAYGNGRIPTSALCPLDGAPGELLRADAAYAFDRLTAAFAARFGRPLCVTDSYRSFDDQVRVRASRPGLAAVPGRSNHGWGTALDLCGGVERFDSPEHRWLQVEAPLFGWFDPAWAQRSGTLPEPWHWEFSG